MSKSILVAWDKKTGLPVSPRDRVTDFRGNSSEFISAIRENTTGRDGLVETKDGVFYANVFNLRVTSVPQ